MISTLIKGIGIHMLRTVLIWLFTNTSCKINWCPWLTNHFCRL